MGADLVVLLFCKCSTFINYAVVNQAAMLKMFRSVISWQFAILKIVKKGLTELGSNPQPLSYGADVLPLPRIVEKHCQQCLKHNNG